MSNPGRNFWIQATIGVYLAALSVFGSSPGWMNAIWVTGATVAAWLCWGYWRDANPGDPNAWSLWRWRKPNDPWHEGQTLLSWWVEQAAVFTLTNAGLRAARRGDRTTARRVDHLLLAGAAWERDERRRIAFNETAGRIAESTNTLRDSLGRMAENVDEAVDFAAFSSSAKFHNTIARERRKGLVFVHNEANRVRREMGLPIDRPGEWLGL